MYIQRLLIDRYIAWTFVKVVVAALVSFAGLYVVIDGLNNYEELTTYAKSQQVGTLTVLVEYYGPRIVDIFDQMSGLVAMVAAMLTITILQRSQELTALMAAGVSKVRVATPLFLGALVLSGLGMVNRELVLPKVRERLTYNAQDLSGQLGRTLTPRYDHHTMLMFTGAKVYPKLRKIDSPQVRLSPDFSSWGQKVMAAEAYYVPANDDHAAGYHFKGVTVPADLSSRATVYFDDKPVLISPADASWLGPGECFVASDLSFEQLTGNSAFCRYLSSAELIAGMNNRSLDFGSDAKIILHSRFLAPLLDITVFLLGLPLVLGRENRNIFVAAGMCAGLVAALLIVTMACHAAGANYLLRPVLAAWLPLVVFAPAAYALARPLWD